jgi:hypothetical protein
LSQLELEPEKEDFQPQAVTTLERLFLTAMALELKQDLQQATTTMAFLSQLNFQLVVVMAGWC